MFCLLSLSVYVGVWVCVDLSLSVCVRVLLHSVCLGVDLRSLFSHVLVCLLVCVCVCLQTFQTDCCEFCQAHPHCKFFSFDKVIRQCYMKSKEVGKLKGNPKIVAGTY